MARIREVIQAINRRIGAYLALKTIISVLLGAVSWVIMTLFGLEFALMWAVLAFYTVFSIAPLLLIVIAVAGFFFGLEDSSFKGPFSVRGSSVPGRVYRTRYQTFGPRPLYPSSENLLYPTYAPRLGAEGLGVVLGE